jgi:hypothetical protein
LEIRATVGEGEREKRQEEERERRGEKVIRSNPLSVPGIQLATSPDLLNWTVVPGIFIPVRNDSFDSLLVEGGKPEECLPLILFSLDLLRRSSADETVRWKLFLYL